MIPTVAKEILLLVHVPPDTPLPSGDVVCTHTIGVPVIAVGAVMVFTVTVPVLEHPNASVPVTVYVMFDVGLAVTDVPVVADKEVAGAHVYVVPPVAVKVFAEPLQDVIPDPALIVGKALTVTLIVELAVPPAPSLTCIVNASAPADVGV